KGALCLFVALFAIGDEVNFCVPIAAMDEVERGIISRPPVFEIGSNVLFPQNLAHRHSANDPATAVLPLLHLLPAATTPDAISQGFEVRIRAWIICESGRPLWSRPDYNCAVFHEFLNLAQRLHGHHSILG